MWWKLFAKYSEIPNFHTIYQSETDYSVFRSTFSVERGWFLLPKQTDQNVSNESLTRYDSFVASGIGLALVTATDYTSQWPDHLVDKVSQFIDYSAYICARRQKLKRLYILWIFTFIKVHWYSSILDCRIFLFWKITILIKTSLEPQSILVLGSGCVHYHYQSKITSWQKQDFSNLT